MLITSIYCAHNMGAAQLSSKLPARGAPARNPPAPWTTPPFSAPPATCDACIAGHALGSFVAHPPKSPTFLLWTLFSLLFLYSPLGKIQLSNANFSPRFYIFFLPVLFYFFFIFLFFSFPLRMFFCFSRKHPKTNFQRISIYLLLIYAACHPHIFSPLWAARSVKQSTSTSTSTSTSRALLNICQVC